MKVEIIAVGNEIVFGHTVNTNAAYLAQMIQKVGMQPAYVTAVCDNIVDIQQAVHHALTRAHVILVTGGLGPTPDDLTKEAVCEALGLTLEINNEQLEIIKAYFNKKGRKMPDNNIKQAAFPKTAYILPNDYGTAPGCILRKEQACIVLLPGPPREMQPMYQKYVLPYFQKNQCDWMKQLDILCFGIEESELAMRIEKDLKSQNQTMRIATYVGQKGQVIVRLNAYGQEAAVVEKELREKAQSLTKCLAPYIIGYNEDKLEEKVVSKLIEKGLKVSTVESCTGGLIAATLINCGGASACLNESVITYSNAAKIKYADVQKSTLDCVGAVSEETAREMAEGIRKRANVDIGLSSTGIAGPGGGTKSKPVGLVYIGIATANTTEVFRLQLNGTRQEIREQTVQHILFQLYQKIK